MFYGCLKFDSFDILAVVYMYCQSWISVNFSEKLAAPVFQAIM